MDMNVSNDPDNDDIAHPSSITTPWNEDLESTFLNVWLRASRWRLLLLGSMLIWPNERCGDSTHLVDLGHCDG